MILPQEVPPYDLRRNATIIVTNMDNSIRFYTEVLGLKLTNRFGNDWATVSAGEGLTIGIHPASPKYPHPGTKGSIILGFDIDVPVEKAVALLANHGVAVKDSIVRSEPGNFVHLEDPDGNDIYLWEKAQQLMPEVERQVRNTTELQEERQVCQRSV